MLATALLVLGGGLVIEASEYGGDTASTGRWSAPVPGDRAVSIGQVALLVLEDLA